MAAGTAQPYNKGLYHMLRQEADFLGGTVKMALLDNAHTPDLVNDEFFDDVSADECADGDYAQQTLGTKTITQNGSGHTVLDAADVDFGNAVTIAARYAVIYIDTGTPATSTLLFLIDLNDGGSANVSSTNSDFDVGFAGTGIYVVDPIAD